MSAAASEAASAAAGTGLRRRKQTPFYKPGNNTMETPESVALPGYLAGKRVSKAAGLNEPLF